MDSRGTKREGKDWNRIPSSSPPRSKLVEDDPLLEDDNNKDENGRECPNTEEASLAAWSLSQAVKKSKGPLNRDDIFFWGGALRSMDMWTCIAERRPFELAKCIAALENRADLNAPHPESGLTPLQTCVVLGRTACTTVLIQHGAKGAADIVKRDNPASHRALPVLLEGCTREELRAIEYAWPSTGPRLVKGTLTKTFIAWVERSGCDSLRTVPGGKSLEDLAKEANNWAAEYYLHKRAIYTFMACNRFGRSQGSIAALLPRDVALMIAQRFVWKIAFCVACHKAQPKPDLMCVSCLEPRVLCTKCVKTAPASSNTCSFCNKKVCPDCARNRCTTGADRLQSVQRLCRNTLCNACWTSGQRICSSCHDRHQKEEEAARKRRDYADVPYYDINMDLENNSEDEEKLGEEEEDRESSSSSSSLSPWMSGAHCYTIDCPEHDPWE
jgi:hypothetical protein